MFEPRVVVIVSANSEWRVVKEFLSPTGITSSPVGETFCKNYRDCTVRYLHGGWGKISAAAGTQYAIDTFHPTLLINLGTCGGFEGRIERRTLLLVTKTIVYDIIEQMSDPEEAIAHYTTELDLTWLPEDSIRVLEGDEFLVVQGPLISADRDLLPTDIPMLVEKYDAVAADWEAGAIAWAAKRNGVRCLILRGVSDLVNSRGGEAYGKIEVFHENTRVIMKTLIGHLPEFLVGIG
jgi:adenosylhomocysteine nucleosidase